MSVEFTRKAGFVKITSSNAPESNFLTMEQDDNTGLTFLDSQDFDISEYSGNDLIAIGEKLNELNGVKND